MAGKFITIEGTEGTGKSTNIAVLEAMFRENGIDCLRTREPGGSAIAEKIRSLLLRNGEEKPADLTELLLIFAARAEHLAKRIKPALASGRWVLCDRFTDATFAYQGGGRGLSGESIATLQTLVQGELRPDLTLIFDLDPEIGLDRVSRRGNLDRFEREIIEFHHRVRRHYLDIARREPERCLLIDATGSPDEVGRRLRGAVIHRLPELQ